MEPGKSDLCFGNYTHEQLSADYTAFVTDLFSRETKFRCKPDNFLLEELFLLCLVQFSPLCRLSRPGLRTNSNHFRDRTSKAGAYV